VTDIQQRKTDHLDLCATDAVAFRGQTTLLEHVRLVHQSLPDLHVDELDLSVELLGKTLRAPIVIAGMTGGTSRAGNVNHGLARVAERRGYGFGLGSQRAMQKVPEAVATYAVREHAPTTLVMGNVGVVQAASQPTEMLDKLVRDIGADALCLHMNPAMELVQPEGDRDFRNGTETFRRLVAELPVPVVAKETGNGISWETARKLRDVGVTTVDVSGAGGTSWVGVETLRATGGKRDLGEALWDWGVPTAAAVHFATTAGHAVIATGGIKSGFDIARAIAMGATAGGIARQVFMAFEEGGEEGAEAFLVQVEHELRSIMLLTGAKTVADLQRAPKVVTGELRDWVALAEPRGK